MKVQSSKALTNILIGLAWAFAFLIGFWVAPLFAQSFDDVENFESEINSSEHFAEAKHAKIIAKERAKMRAMQAERRRARAEALAFQREQHLKREHELRALREKQDLDPEKARYRRMKEIASEKRERVQRQQSKYLDDEPASDRPARVRSISSESELAETAREIERIRSDRRRLAEQQAKIRRERLATEQKLIDLQRQIAVQRQTQANEQAQAVHEEKNLARMKAQLAELQNKIRIEEAKSMPPRMLTVDKQTVASQSDEGASISRPQQVSPQTIPVDIPEEEITRALRPAAQVNPQFVSSKKETLLSPQNRSRADGMVVTQIPVAKTKRVRRAPKPKKLIAKTQAKRVSIRVVREQL